MGGQRRRGSAPHPSIPGPEAVAPPLPLPPLSLKGRGGRMALPLPAARGGGRAGTAEERGLLINK